MGSKRIVNLDSLEYREWNEGERYAGRMGEIGEAVGAQKLGYNLTAIPPGKAAFPMHCHHANEEMFLVLEGEGEIRMGDEVHPLRQGDVVCCPVGGKDTAHQIINTMDEGELRFLAVSTVNYPEICEYPDSGKTLVRHWLEDGETVLKILSKDQGKVPYWDEDA